MLKDFRRLALLTVFLTIVSVFVIVVMGSSYTVVFSDFQSDDYQLILDNETGEVEIVNEWQSGDKYFITVKAKKAGKVSLNLDYGNFAYVKILYIHRSMIITDNNFLGKSTCSEIIPISLSIVFIYVIGILLKRYIRHKRENLYQYKNIAYLGLIIYLSFFVVNTFLSIFNYQGLFETVNNISSTLIFVSFIFLPVFMITFILVTISNVQLIIKEGKSIGNLLGTILGIFLCLLPLLPDFVYGILMKIQVVDIYNLNTIGPYIYGFVEYSVYLVIVYLECILLGTIILALKSIFKKVSYDKDYIIILGCQIAKDGSLKPLLKGRVDKALEFREKQLKASGKDIIFIPSGGKGDDEIISEAEAIKNYLLEHGIDEKNILVEDKSRNTYENLKFSRRLIKKKDANIVFATTNYHVLRAGLIASEQGLVMEGIGSKTKSYFWINAFIREYIGTLYAERKKHIFILLFIVVVIICMLLITYFANNI